METHTHTQSQINNGGARKRWMNWLSRSVLQVRTVDSLIIVSFFVFSTVVPLCCEYFLQDRTLPVRTFNKGLNPCQLLHGFNQPDVLNPTTYANTLHTLH